MTLKLLCRQYYACCHQTAEARITRFRNKVALHLSYLHKFDNEIKWKPFEFQA